MKRKTKTYDNEYKAQAVKLAQEIGAAKAAKELGVPEGTVYGWIKAFKEGRLSATDAIHTPKNALSLNEELIELRKRLREQEKENRRNEQQQGISRNDGDLRQRRAKRHRRQQPQPHITFKCA